MKEKIWEKKTKNEKKNRKKKKKNEKKNVLSIFHVWKVFLRKLH